MLANEAYREPIEVDQYPLTKEDMTDRLRLAETWPEVMSTFAEMLTADEDYQESTTGESITPDFAKILTDATVEYLVEQGQEPQVILKQLVPEVAVRAKSSNKSGFLAGLGMTLAGRDMIAQAIELVDTQSRAIVAEHRALVLFAIGEAYFRDGDRYKGVNYMIRAFKTNYVIDPKDDFEFLHNLDNVLANLAKMADSVGQSTSVQTEFDF